MEQFFQDNRTYAGACVRARSRRCRPRDEFHLHLSGLGLSPYTITATGVGAWQGFLFDRRATSARPS